MAGAFCLLCGAACSLPKPGAWRGLQPLWAAGRAHAPSGWLPATIRKVLLVLERLASGRAGLHELADGWPLDGGSIDSQPTHAAPAPPMPNCYHILGAHAYVGDLRKALSSGGDGIPRQTRQALAGYRLPGGGQPSPAVPFTPFHTLPPRSLRGGLGCNALQRPREPSACRAIVQARPPFPTMLAARR